MATVAPLLRRGLRSTTVWVRTSSSLTRAALQRVRQGPTVRLLAAALLVLVVATGLAESLARNLSGVEVLILGFALVVALTVLWARRSPRIFPFGNLVRGAASGAYESLAAGFAVNLDLEIRRINRLRGETSTSEVSNLDSPGLGLGETPSRSRHGSQFKDTAVASGTDQEIGEVEVGSLDVGPLRLPIGRLLNFAARAVGRAVSGSVLAGPSHVRVVAAYSGRPKYKWEAERELAFGEDPDAHARELARELAYQIVWDLDGSTSAEADWRSFGQVIDGIEHFGNYRARGEPSDLANAQSSFLAAIVISPHFGAAYHDLAVTIADREPSDLPMKDGSFVGTAPNLWRRAVELNPRLAAAHVRLAHMALEAGDIKPAIDAASAAVTLAEQDRKPCAAARYWLGSALLDLAEHGGPADVRDATMQFKMARRELLSVRRRLRWAGATAADVSAIDRELAQVVVAQAKVYTLSSFGTMSIPRRRLAFKRWRSRPPRAEAALRSAVKTQPNESVWCAELGAYLADHRDPGALDQLVESLRLDPRNADALSTLGKLLASWDDPASHDAARAAFRIALALEPRDPEPWAMLGLYENSYGQVGDATALMTMASVLSPTNATYCRQLADLWRQEERNSIAEGRAEAYAGLADVLAHPEGAHGGVDALLTAFSASPESIRRPKQAVLSLARAWMRVREVDDAGLGDALVALHDLGRGELAAFLPEGSLPPYELGRLHRKVDDADHLEQAIALLEQASTTELPGGLDIPAPWLLDLADAYADRNQYSEAIERYTATLDLRPEWLRIEASKGRLAEVRGERPGLGITARALAGRGAAHLNLGHHAEARLDCESAIALEPLYAFPHQVLANLFSQRGDHKRAIESWRQFKARLPTVPVLVHSSIGDAIVEAAQEVGLGSDREKELLTQALSEYERAISGDVASDSESAIRAALSDCLERLGDTDRARVERERAVKAAQGRFDEAERREALGRMYDAMRRWGDAEAQYRVALELRRGQFRDRAGADDEVTLNLSESLNELAWFYAEQAYNLVEARRLSDEALSLVVSNNDCEKRANYLDTRGWLAYLQEDVDSAVADLDEAMNLAVPTTIRRAHFAIALDARVAQTPEHPEHQADIAMALRQWCLILNLDPDGEWASAATSRSATGDHPAATAELLHGGA